MREAWITFRGGPLGGERRKLPINGRTIRVPAFFNISVTAYAKDCALQVLDTEEYELMNFSGPEEVEAQWKHPQQRLLLENKKLKERVKDLERFAEAFDAIKDLVKTW